MSIFAIILVLISAIVHASWNLLGKANNSTPAFFYLANAMGALLLLPLVFWVQLQTPTIQLSNTFWLLLLASGLCQMIYMVGLANAYKHADVAIVYPIARALPVLTVAVGATWLGLTLAPLTWLAMLCITLGCLFVPLDSLRGWHWRNYLTQGCYWAVFAAAGTAGYSIIDKQALVLLSSQFKVTIPASITALYYLGLQFFSTTLVFSLAFILPIQRQQLRQAWQYKFQAITAGSMIALTYGLVLWAMTMTENVSYIVALRQTSIPVGVLLAIIILKEKTYTVRLFGTLLIFIGLLGTSL